MKDNASKINEEHRTRLHICTDDEMLLMNADRAAFCQHDLDRLVHEGVSPIYICADEVEIPAKASGIMFVGINVPRSKGSSAPLVRIDDLKRPDTNVYENIIISDGSKEQRKAIGRGLDARARQIQDALAKGGVAEAIWYIAMMYFEGDGVVQNRQHALEWFHRAAALGSAKAQYKIGLIFDNAMAGEPNPDEAIRWFRKAAEQDHGGAIRRHRKLRLAGYGDEKDDAIVINKLIRAAAAGVREEQYVLATMYAAGQIVEKNDSEASRWFLEAAEQGHVDAMTTLADRYVRGAGLKQNMERAAFWYCMGDAVSDEMRDVLYRLHRRALEGDAAAQAELAEEYLARYHRSYGSIAASEGERWYKLALGQERIRSAAEYYIGVIRARSTDPAVRQEALGWFLSAAEHGNKDAQAMVGEICIHGWYGVPLDLEQAYMWLRKSVDDRDPNEYGMEAAELSLALGVMTDFGIGCKADPAAAGLWYRKACSLFGEVMDGGIYSGIPRFLYLDGVLLPLGSKESLTQLKAAERLHVGAACLKLAAYYERGIGIAVDTVKAAKLRERAGDMQQVLADFI